jgi:tetraacyldisaccharide 4'-kinase
MERWLTRRWYGDSAPLMLQPLSWLYGAAISLRHGAYARGWLRSYGAGRPVLVVGNLTVGGTGKTPLVAWIAQQFTACGLKAGIISRGYKRAETAPRIVEVNSDWRQVGDEPLLLRRATNCLTVVAADRVAGAKLLAKQDVDVIIADDGLQHLRLARDCEIVVIDGTRGFGNGELLPAGPLREPASRLASVDAVIVNGSCEPVPVAADCLYLQMKLASDQVLPVSGTAEARPLESLRGERVHAVAGIGNPKRFFNDLRQHGLEVIEHPFPDHHAFTAADLQFDDELPMLMTEKDAVKCRAIATPRMGYVPVSVRFSEAGAQQLLERVLYKLGLVVPNKRG